MTAAQKKLDAEIKKITTQSGKLASSMPTQSNIANTPGVGEGCMALAPYTPSGNILITVDFLLIWLHIGSDGSGPSSTQITDIHRALNNLYKLQKVDNPQWQSSEAPMQYPEASGGKGKGKGKGWGYSNDEYGSGGKGRGQDNGWQGNAPSWNTGSDWYTW